MINGASIACTEDGWREYARRARQLADAMTAPLFDDDQMRHLERRLGNSASEVLEELRKARREIRSEAQLSIAGRLFLMSRRDLIEMAKSMNEAADSMSEPRFTPDDLSMIRAHLDRYAFPDNFMNALKEARKPRT